MMNILKEMYIFPRRFQRRVVEGRIDSDATYRIRETRKRDITRKNVKSGNISHS